MEEIELKRRSRSVLVSLSYLSFLFSLSLSSHIFTAFCHLFRGPPYFCISWSSSRKDFSCRRQRADRQTTVFFQLLLFVFSLSVSYVHRGGRDTHVSARPLVLAVDALRRGQSNPAFTKLGSVLLPSHLPRAQRSATMSLLHLLPSRSAYHFSPLPFFASAIQRRLREVAQMETVVSGAHAYRSNPPFFTYYGPDLWKRRFSIEADSLLLPGPSTAVPRASSPSAASLLLERNFSCRKLSRTSLSFSPTSSVSPSSPPSFSSSSVSGRSSRVSIQVRRRRAPPADRPKPMELQVESGAESPTSREDVLKRKENRLEKPSATDQPTSDGENLAAADEETEASLPDGVGTEGTKAFDPYWSPRAEEITDDMAFGIARNARYEQKLKMPPPLVPPNGSGFHREPILPEHLYPHEVRCPPHWIPYGPHCVTLVTVPPWTTCPGDKSFRHHGLRSKMAVMSPGICAVVKETGVSLVCPKGYEPELTEFPAFKPKDLENGSADSSEPLGRAFTCTQIDSIPLDIQSGKPCPLGYSVSEFGTCEGQKHVGPSLSCPLGFDLGGEQVNPYVTRGKEYAKCGAVEYYKGKVWCPTGFVPLGLNLPNLPYGSSLDSFALTYSIKEFMASNGSSLRRLQEIKPSFQMQSEKARLEEIAAELKKSFPPSFVEVLLTNSLKELNASAPSSPAESKWHRMQGERTDDTLKDTSREHPTMVREDLVVDQHYSKGAEWSEGVLHGKTGKAGSPSTEKIHAEADVRDAVSGMELLLDEDSIQWLTDFEEERNDHFGENEEETGKEESLWGSAGRGSTQMETEGITSPALKYELWASTGVHRRMIPHNKYAGGFTEYSVRRNLQQGASPPGEGMSGIPDIYMKLQAKLPPGGGCAQVVAAFEAHCDKVECQTEYMQKMKSHIFNWLDHRLRSDVRQIDQLIPSGKDYRYTSPG